MVPSPAPSAAPSATTTVAPQPTVTPPAPTPAPPTTVSAPPPVVATPTPPAPAPAPPPKAAPAAPPPPPPEPEPARRKRKLREYTRELAPDLAVELGLDNLFSEVLDTFIDTAAGDSIRLAAHRNSNRVEVKDMAFVLEHYHDIVVPGFNVQVPKKVHLEAEGERKRGRQVAPRRPAAKRDEE
ncbi:hypothetical protein VHUM_00315 [Vanrija humicola]|uniref:Transcription initiation factor TFIID subunit 12 domain-containing protein n=1 Tax=Vanrija humicola TaxID=5417 RepID=A0A7D8V488_VANHU|nr:hypothetical protein VHUM_00315 [Vanrija humicola]